MTHFSKQYFNFAPWTITFEKVLAERWKYFKAIESIRKSAVTESFASCFSQFRFPVLRQQQHQQQDGS